MYNGHTHCKQSPDVHLSSCTYIFFDEYAIVSAFLAKAGLHTARAVMPVAVEIPVKLPSLENPIVGVLRSAVLRPPCALLAPLLRHRARCSSAVLACRPRVARTRAWHPRPSNRVGAGTLPPGLSLARLCSLPRGSVVISGAWRACQPQRVQCTRPCARQRARMWRCGVHMHGWMGILWGGVAPRRQGIHIQAVLVLITFPTNSNYHRRVKPYQIGSKPYV